LTIYVSEKGASGMLVLSVDPGLAFVGFVQIKLPFYGDDFLGIAESPLAC
jgi:hypothetical protein